MIRKITRRLRACLWSYFERVGLILHVFNDSKDYYAAIKDDPALHVKLTGSWEVTVGEHLDAALGTVRVDQRVYDGRFSSSPSLLATATFVLVAIIILSSPKW